MILGYYIDNQGIYDNEGGHRLNVSGTEAFDVLLRKDIKENKLFYDLDCCVASLIKMALNKAQAEELYEKERVWVNGYKITYFPDRFFAIDKGRAFVNFGNMTRYKSDVHYNPDDTLEDKLAKAKEAGDMAKEAGEVLGQLGLSRQKITSPVSGIVEKYVNSLHLPTIDDVPEEAAEIAYMTVKGNWLESYVCGSWDEVWDYDVNGSYGSFLQSLLDLRRGEWVKSDSIPANAYYGFADGLLTSRYPFNPFLMIGDNDVNPTPIGTRPEQLTLQHLRLMEKFPQLGEFRIDRGWWWIPKDTVSKYEPLKGIVNHLWNIRSKSEGLKKAIIRSCLAGIWGRFGQELKGEFGDLFNPVYSSIVCNGNDIKVADMCLSQGVIPLQVAVDGVIVDRPLDIEDSRELGQWRLSHKGKCIIVSSGVVAMEGKEGAEEFALTYDWLHDRLGEHPEKSEYQMEKWSPITLGKALEQGCFEKIGQLEKITRTVYIGKDPKRLWKEYPRNGGELLKGQYKSEPIDAIMAGASVGA